LDDRTRIITGFPVPFAEPGRVTFPGRQSDDLAPGTLNSILKHAALKS